MRSRRRRRERARGYHESGEGGAAGRQDRGRGGHELWPRGTAHLSILTDPHHRRRGLAARAVGSAAVGDALAQGLLCQWRGRTLASRRVAHTLGFQGTSSQLSLRLSGD
ncbi:GNAT family N-acetyltransferase [Streptomyces sp. NPDC059611]|uniref:GNAT family N-acetyltransferase n=1 Tax=Streptomyces sp. NPDC059611 TaxID=3346884 RepID=UPI00367A26A4